MGNTRNTGYLQNIVQYDASNNIILPSLTGTGNRMVVTSSTGLLSSQAIPTLSSLSGVPNSRTLTINGVTYDLSSDRTWSVIPTGGTTGQLLAKSSSTDYATQWIDNYTSQIKHEVKLAENMSIGTAIYVSGSTGQAGTNMLVSKASNATEGTSSKTLGLLAFTGVTNDLGFVITEGLLAGLDTSTAGAVGDPVWLGVNGALIFGLANKPVAPAHLVFIGVVTRKQQINGEIFVKVQNGFEFGEVHNYVENGVQDNYVISYEYSTNLYKPKSIATLLGYTPVTNARTITINGTSYDLSADRSWTINSMVYPGAGIAVSTGTAWGTSLTDNSTNWNTAYGWGNHASAGYATTSYVGTQIANLVASAPATLDTLNELAAALGNDAAFSTTVSTALGNRLRVDINTQGLSATLQGYGRTNLGLGTAATANTGDFAAASHTHSIANVTGLQTALDGKQASGSYAASVHTHIISDVTGLQTALDGKQASLGFTPYNATNPSGYITSSANITGTSAGVSVSLTGANATNVIYATIADNDFFRIRVGGDASNVGWAEIATADDGTEPIYVRQYTGVFSSLTRTATLLDGSGNTSFPGTLNIGNSTEVLGLIQMGASGRYGMGVSSAYLNLYSHDSGSGVRLGSYNGTTFTPVLTVANTGAVTATGNITGANLSGTNTGDQTTISGNAGSATLLKSINTTSSVLSNWNPQGLTYQAWGQAWAHSSISADTGDMVLWLRAAQYSAGGTEVCMMIDGDYYAGSGAQKVLHAGNYSSYALSLSGGALSGSLSIKNTSSLIQAPYQSDHDFPNGAYIQTDISVGNAEPWTCEITAFNYGGGRPTKITINAYNYGPGTYYAGYAIATGLGISGMSVFQNSSGYLCLYIPSQGYWNAYNVNWYVNYRTNSSNRVTSISNSTKPTGISYENAVNPTYSLDLANYSSYVLPLSGGTVTGGVTFGNNSSSDQGIYINYGNYVSGYGRIRFNQDGTNHSTIHSFSASWQNSTAYTASTGCINIDGQNGVTFGGWNTANAAITSEGLAIKPYTTPSGAKAWNSAGRIRVQQSDGTDVFIEMRNRADSGDYAGILFTDNNIGGYIGFRTYAANNLAAGSDCMIYGTYNDHIFQNGSSETFNGKTETFRIYANGSVRATGDITAYSDIRVKENIITIDKALEKTLQLRGVFYNRIDKDDKSQKVGVIAQEIQKILPQVVDEDYNGLLSVSYGNITGLLIEAVKEQQTQIESQKTEIEELKDLVKQLINK